MRRLAGPLAGILFPYVAGEGTRLSHGDPESYRLDLVSAIASSNGIVELQYRRHR